MRTNLIRCAFVAAVLLGAHRPILARDSCDFASPVSARANLILEDTQLSEQGRFLGRFELSNVGFDDPLVLRGIRAKDVFTMNDPEVSVQFRDLNGRWVSFASLTGDYISSDRMEIKVHSRGSFMVDLMSQEDANKSASDFRILVRLSRPDICIISKPFRGIPARQPVVGFEQSP